ncbi:hypothetical protein GC173_04380 [bacterium]|nr:hypothetical protein [bacterium]
MAELLHGSHMQTLDERQRLPIPSKLVPVMRELAGVTNEEDDFMVVVTLTDRKTVAVYPKPVFDKMIDGLDRKIKKRPTPPLLKLRRAYVNMMDVQSLDKQNRVKVPQLHAGLMKLTKEVAVVGSGDYLEIMSVGRYEEIMNEVLPTMSEWSDSLLLGQTDEDDGNEDAG